MGEEVAGRRRDRRARGFHGLAKAKEIIPRRQKERDLFFDGKWSNSGTVTEYTRVSASGTPVWSSAGATDI